MSCGDSHENNQNAAEISAIAKETGLPVSDISDLFHEVIATRKEELGIPKGGGTREQQQEVEAWARRSLRQEIDERPRCEVCGRFSGSSHVCPPKKLREFAVAEDTKTSKVLGDLYQAEERLNARGRNLQGLAGYSRKSDGTFSGTALQARNDLEQILENAPEGEEWIKTPSSFGGERSKSVSQIREAIASYNEEMKEYTKHGERLAAQNEIYDRHRWNRAFLVVGNTGGHVHRSMGCSTCYPTTRFVLLPDYSGSDEDQIVSDAGERACTVCYPSAPVDVLSRPTKMYSEDEKQQAADREARREAAEKKKSDKAAKAPTASGEPLRIVVDRVESRRNPGTMVEQVEELKTERTATSWAVDRMWWAEYRIKNNSANGKFGPDGLDDFEREGISQVVSSLAEKHGKSEADIRADLDKKLVAKKKREG